MLLMFNAASYALTTEAMTDGQILVAAMGVLQKMYGASIPAYTKYLITRWQADPYAFGSYSYAKVGATNTTRTAFAVIILFFILIRHRFIFFLFRVIAPDPVVRRLYPFASFFNHSSHRSYFHLPLPCCL